MQEVQIKAVIPREKGRLLIRFDTGMEVTLYRSEICGLGREEQKFLLTEEAYITQELYQKILTKIVGVRVKKRAMFLLEQMDRTENQLYDKLKQNGYPQVCIEEAIAYVKQYHYIDDLRYARQYVRYHQDKKSRQRLRMDLVKKGVGREYIEQALEEEFVSDERGKIKELLEKRHYDYDNADWKEQQKTYQFLIRRGYKSGDILAVLREGDAFAEE